MTRQTGGPQLTVGAPPACTGDLLSPGSSLMPPVQPSEARESSFTITRDNPGVCANRDVCRSPLFIPLPNASSSCRYPLTQVNIQRWLKSQPNSALGLHFSLKLACGIMRTQQSHQTIAQRSSGAVAEFYCPESPVLLCQE